MFCALSNGMLCCMCVCLTNVLQSKSINGFNIRSISASQFSSSLLDWYIYEFTIVSISLYNKLHHSQFRYFCCVWLCVLPKHTFSFLNGHTILYFSVFWIDKSVYIVMNEHSLDSISWLWSIFLSLRISTWFGLIQSDPCNLNAYHNTMNYMVIINDTQCAISNMHQLTD